MASIMNNFINSIYNLDNSLNTIEKDYNLKIINELKETNEYLNITIKELREENEIQMNTIMELKDANYIQMINDIEILKNSIKELVEMNKFLEISIKELKNDIDSLNKYQRKSINKYDLRLDR
jgi:hypothetical protein